MRTFTNRHLLNSILVVVLMVSVRVADAQVKQVRQSCERVEVTPLLVETVAGSARLCVSHNGLRGWMLARGLVPGDAYTLWWVYIDDPSLCDPESGCGFETFAGANPLAVFGRLGSLVATTSGRAFFSDSLLGMRPSPGAEVWLLLVEHGAAEEGARLARQLLTPEDPRAGAPHLGLPEDGVLGFNAAIAKFVAP